MRETSLGPPGSPVETSDCVRSVNVHYGLRLTLGRLDDLVIRAVNQVVMSPGCFDYVE